MVKGVRTGQLQSFPQYFWAEFLPSRSLPDWGYPERKTQLTSVDSLDRFGRYFEAHRDKVHLQGLPDGRPLHDFVSKVEDHKNRDIDVYQYAVISHPHVKSIVCTYTLLKTSPH